MNPAPEITCPNCGCVGLHGCIGLKPAPITPEAQKTLEAVMQKIKEPR